MMVAVNAVQDRVMAGYGAAATIAGGIAPDVPGTGRLTYSIADINARDAGQEMHRFMADLFPICRSITGNGFRQTLSQIAKRIPLETHEVPTGTRVFDWTVPKEWNIQDAWIKDDRGTKVLDFARSNLHVVNYSVPVRRRMTLAELRPHIHTLPEQPDWTPYRTSYYTEGWGFCLAHHQFKALADGEYEVCIDAQLEDGFLTYGEYYLPGQSQEEVLFSCHACHPSLANDNLSGVALVVWLARLLTHVRREYSYRFLFIPGTIGSITWLARNEARVARIRHGLVVACVGDPGKFHYKRSRQGAAEIDRAVAHALTHCGTEFEIRDFSPYGYDERQYCSPGFDLPVGSLTRTPHGKYREYHTSADNLDLVRAEALGGSLALYLSVVRILENNAHFVNLNSKCEPQLGRRGLYRPVGGSADAGRLELAMLWTLNLSDGKHSLLDIADRSGLPFDDVLKAAQTLQQHELLTRVRTRAGDEDSSQEASGRIDP